MSLMDESAEPFEDDLEHLDAELTRLDLLCRIRLRTWQAERGAAVDDFHGLYVSDEEVERLLEPAVDDPGRATGRRPRGDRNQATTLVDRLEAVSRTLQRRTRLTIEAGTELRLATLADRFGLERRELDALLIAAAPALDTKYGRIYSYLQDDVERTRPTIDLTLQLLAGTRRGRLTARSLFARRSPLVRYRLVRLFGGDDRPLPGRIVALDERVVAFLLGSDEMDAVLASVASVAVPDVSLANVPVDSETEARLTAMADRLDGGIDVESRDGRTPSFTYVHGRYGSGTSAAVSALSAHVRRGSPLLTIDAEEATGTDLIDLVPAIDREARLRKAGVHVANVDALITGDAEDADGVLAAVVAEFDGINGDVYLSGRTALPTRIQLRVRTHEFAALHLPTPAYDRRVECWRAVPELPAEVDPLDLASKFRFTAGQIDDAVRTAGILARSEGRDASSEADVYEACRAQCGEQLDALARKVVPVYDWDDIVLPADVLAHLQEVAAHIDHHGRVYTDWGFEGRFSLGNGVTALFSGPSGTGKTMAAEVIAGEAGLDLFKIDLSRVVSKYVGETEKNLRRVFDEAEDSNAILLFDEADALFGKRSEVKDAHDRYANVEVNYLLQRIEEYDGIVVLTTNFEGNVDDAFLRRITHSVEFPLPDREARTAIWRRIFPEETPVGTLDIEFLAGLDSTGGNIKNIALNAAFLAAADADVVEMDHVLRAVRREFEKTGTLIDPDEFGAYYRIVQQPT